jgi:hypothetical protein
VTSHEETEDYFDKTRLDNYLVLAIREVIKGNHFPKNPFPRILRSLKQSLWYNTSASDIAKRKEVVVDNFLDKDEIGFSIHSTKRTAGIYGYKYLLTKINIDTVIFMKKYFADYLFKRYERKGEYEVGSNKTQISTDFSLSGSYILEGFMLPYPMSSEKFIEINYHLTISGPLLKKAVDIAIKQVV